MGSIHFQKQKFESHSATGGYARGPTEADPYRYQTGFGNRFTSEAVYVLPHLPHLLIASAEKATFTRPGTLPVDGRNLPQRSKYDLYIEQVKKSLPSSADCSTCVS